MKRETRFLIYTDLHNDIMPDGYERLQEIVQSANREEVDFVICLGDLAMPKDENRPISELLKELRMPHYIALGNHDMDHNDKSAFLDFYQQDRAYFSFDSKGYHFLVLDSNSFRHHALCYDYSHGNYYRFPLRETLSDIQLDWLAADVRQTSKPCILFSHAPLFRVNETGGCANLQQVHELLTTLNAQAGWKKVCASFNGHNHTDSYLLWDGIHHFDVNSTSNQWLGDSECCRQLEPDERYNSQTHARHPYLRMTAPYANPLYAIVTIDPSDSSLHLQGRQSTFIGGTPVERRHSGFTEGIWDTPVITDRSVLLEKPPA